MPMFLCKILNTVADNHSYKEQTDRTLTRDDGRLTSTPLPTKDEKPKSFHTTPPPQAKAVTPVRDGARPKQEQSTGTFT